CWSPINAPLSFWNEVATQVCIEFTNNPTKEKSENSCRFFSFRVWIPINLRGAKIEVVAPKSQTRLDQLLAPHKNFQTCSAEFVKSFLPTIPRLVPFKLLFYDR